MIVLKILGITVLVLLLLILLLLAVILFVPIRYYAEGEKGRPALEKKGGGEKQASDSGELRFRVSWLCGLVRLKGRLDKNGLKYRLKALHLTLRESDDKGTA